MTGALVIGRDGLIGRSLMRRLPQFFSPVSGTSRRQQTRGEPEFLILDLSKDIPTQQFLDMPESIRTAFLCAAIPRFEDCENDRAGSFRVNVWSIVRIAELLLSRAIRIVFLSTNAVFSGDHPRRCECAITDAVTEYGRQKAEAEKRLRALSGMGGDQPEVIIARLTKVVSSGMPLIKGWLNSMQRGEVIEAYDDLVFAPISLNYVTKALIELGISAVPGTYHISGARDITYWDFALRLADVLGRPRHKVLPVKTPGGRKGRQIIQPKFSALAMDATEAAISTSPQDLDDVAKDIVREWRADQ